MEAIVVHPVAHRAVLLGLRAALMVSIYREFSIMTAVAVVVVVVLAVLEALVAVTRMILGYGVVVSLTLHYVALSILSQESVNYYGQQEFG
jgi:hypothetical protein